jgi:hypothetical protein
LQDQVTLLEETITEQGEQQRTLHAAIDRVEREQGRQHQELHATIDPVAAAQRNLGQANQGRRRAGDDGIDTGDGAFLPTTHKLEFLKFDNTSGPLPWLNRCESYFLVHRTPEHQRVAFAAFYLLDDAQLWFHHLELNDGRPTWPQFVQLVNARFGLPVTDSPVGALAMLRRSSSVDDYAKQFMALSCRDTFLTEPLQVELFITGLGDPLRTDVALQQPASLDAAVIFARAYEQRNISRDVPPTTARSMPRSSYRSAPASALLPAAVGLATSLTSVNKPMTTIRLSPTEIAQRRKDGKCFHCDEFFVHEHKEHCKRLFSIEAVFDEECVGDPPNGGEPTISIHALTRIQPHTGRTMHVHVHIAGTLLVALLDTESTHNFINTDATTRAGLALLGSSGLRVTVANDDRVTSPDCCRDLSVSIGNEQFIIDYYGLSIGSYDMVLRVQLLESLGPVLWDFTSRTIAFVRNGHHVLWTAVGSPTPSPYLAAVSADPMEDLLQSFASLFDTPTGLPPPQDRQHRIRLVPRTTPVAIRPYRYAHLQKEELERQCAVMLTQGVIRPSSSAFSAPMLLVKKADDSWRFCADYRVLNAKTVKDKFP